MSESDAIIDNWALMGSPVPIIFITVFYLLFVLKLGPWWMESRKPFNLKMVLILYNASQVVLSTAYFTQPLFLYGINGFSRTLQLTCNGDSDHQVLIWKSIWWFMLMKIFELLDTVFFVLRKKQTQVSFLHVYHHTIMVAFTWGYLKSKPGKYTFLADSLAGITFKYHFYYRIGKKAKRLVGFIFLGIEGSVESLLNSFVHIFMYSYYLIAALGPRFQKYLWWKKYLTALQLAQFGIILAYLCFMVVECNTSRTSVIFFAVNAIGFVLLFANFYKKAYLGKKTTEKKKN